MPGHQEFAYRIRKVSPERAEWCRKRTREALEDEFGSVAAASASRLELPGDAGSLPPEVELWRLSGPGSRSAETVIVTLGLSDPRIESDPERCGLGYELFIRASGGGDWAAQTLVHLAAWELSAGLDLLGRVREAGALTVEKVPTLKAPLDALLILPAGSTGRESPPSAPQASGFGPKERTELLVAVLLHQDEMQWALRYGRLRLCRLLEESGTGTLSHPDRPSLLESAPLRRTLTSLQMEGWYERLDDSGIAAYFLDEIQHRYGADWTRLELTLEVAGSARLEVKFAALPAVRLEWRPGQSAPALEGAPLSSLPEAAGELAELMKIVAARPGVIEDGRWQAVLMEIHPDAEGFEVNWSFQYGEGAERDSCRPQA